MIRDRQKAYDLKSKVHRKLAALKRRGMIADFKFLGIHYVLVYFATGDAAKLMAVHKVLKLFKSDKDVERQAKL